jgi:hypothetical protein
MDIGFAGAEEAKRSDTMTLLREYVERLYVPAVQTYRSRSANSARKAVLLCRWRESIETLWPRLHFGRLELRKEGDHYGFTVPVY